MNGSVTGSLRLLLRLEGLAVLIVSAACYARFGSGWGQFALCFLLPDLALLAYLFNPRAGACAYNITHSYLGALACVAVGILAGEALWLSAGLIWCAHIGFDRALGYGLKYVEGFRQTHLGLIGKPGRS